MAMNFLGVAACLALAAGLTAHITGCTAAETKVRSYPGALAGELTRCVEQPQGTYELATQCLEQASEQQDRRLAAAERRFFEIATPEERVAYRLDLNSWLAALDRSCALPGDRPTDAQRLARLRCRILEKAKQADRVNANVAERRDRVRIPTVRAGYIECLDHADGVTPALQDCIEKEFDYQQQRLATAEHVLAMRLAPNELAEYRRQLLIWQSKVAAECEWDAQTEGQGQRFAGNDCALARLAERAADAERQTK